MSVMPDSENTLDIARQFIDVMNKGDQEAFAALLAPQAVSYSVATGETDTGWEDVARNLLSYRRTFPDLHEEIANAFASGDQAAIETVVTATYDGVVILTIPGSGSRVNLQACHILRVQDSKIVNITTYADYRTLMGQLDMIMTPGSGQ
jgi:steroid delta-isomerase-like uncharacterized protein